MGTIGYAADSPASSEQERIFPIDAAEVYGHGPKSSWGRMSRPYFCAARFREFTVSMVELLSMVLPGFFAFLR
jgi:hypothetical protein